MITQLSIEKVFDSANIVDIVGRYVTLKKSGSNHKGLCPFHNEKTPSFLVNPAKGIYKCFGCGEGGSVVDFIMKHERLTFPEAIKQLASDIGIEVHYEEQTPADVQKQKEEETRREQLLIINNMAKAYFIEQLHNNTRAMEYALDRMNPDDIDSWMVGYAPDQWDGLLNYFRAKGVKEESFLHSTLIKESQKASKLYDYFRGRLIFPIIDKAGRVIGFGGRVLTEEKQTAKYLNSPDTVVYNKSVSLYGLWQARKEIIKTDVCNLVEGYTDVISLHQSGFINTVSASGTSVTIGQLKIIQKLTNNINLIGDGDNAGKKSMHRTGEMALQLGMNVSVIPLPEGMDPDDILKQEREHAAAV